LAQLQISVLGHSTEVPTGIIQKEGDINMLFTHSCLYAYFQLKPKVFQEGNWCRTV